jgi:hypothetical protein
VVLRVRALALCFVLLLALPQVALGSTQLRAVTLLRSFRATPSTCYSY